MLNTKFTIFNANIINFNFNLNIHRFKYKPPVRPSDSPVEMACAAVIHALLPFTPP